MRVWILSEVPVALRKRRSTPGSPYALLTDRLLTTAFCLIMQSTSDLTSRLAAIIQELTAPQVVEVKAARYVRVALAVQLTGYSDKAIRRKMEDGVWREGAVWLPGADGGRQKALMEAVFGKQEERKVG